MNDARFGALSILKAECGVQIGSIARNPESIAFIQEVSASWRFTDGA